MDPTSVTPESPTMPPDMPYPYPGWWMLLYDPMFSIVWPMSLIVQIACIIHVVKTGRPYWWIYVIFCFPVAGLAAYIFLEVKPQWNRLNFQAMLWNFKSSRERIEIRRQILHESSTIKNRLALADEFQAAGQHDEECRVVAEGLAGPFKDDVQLLMRLAQAQLDAGRPAEARQILARTAPERSSDSQHQFSLLKARVAGSLGHAAEAEREFQSLTAKKKSEGPRFYYAEYLLKSGAAERRSEALATLKDILHQYRRGTSVWRHQERRWFYAAKQLLKSPAPKPAARAKGPIGEKTRNA